MQGVRKIPEPIEEGEGVKRDFRAHMYKRGCMKL